MNVDEEIKQLEAFMGKPFYRRPRILPWTYENVEDFLIEEAKLHARKKPSHIDVKIKLKSGESSYNFRTHSIITVDDKTSIFHELGHAYTFDQWPQAYTERRSFAGKIRTEDDWRTHFANSALFEGIASYIALSIHDNLAERMGLLRRRPALTEEALTYLHEEVGGSFGFRKNKHSAYGLGFSLVDKFCAGREPYEAIEELITINPSIVEMGQIILEARK